jgi:predicted MFS family arabinose efflux permease
MLAVGFILFVLTRYRSPALAGAATFLLLVPGLALSPIAGTLLDRYRRGVLIAADYFLMAVVLLVLAFLSFRGALPPPLLLVLSGVASLTRPLSAAGARSMFPSLVPAELWDRANALDSSSQTVANVIGAPLAGVLVSLAGPEWALAVPAVLYAMSGAAVAGLQDPSPKDRASGVLKEAWTGLLYVLRNRTLAGLALTFLGYGAGWGCLVIAVPVLVLSRLHQSPAVVGLIWGLLGAAGFVATLAFGPLRTLGRERSLMSISILAMAAALALLPFASSVAAVAAVLVIAVIAEAPFGIAFLTLRQRRTDPTRFGRAFAISMSLNVAGNPVGAVIAGPLIGWSLAGALWVAAALVAVGALVPMLVIPARDEQHKSN